MRRRHRRYAVVAITDEFKSSQTCATCFSALVRPKCLKLIKGAYRRRSTNGSSLCMNRKCQSYLAGRNTRNRDVEAAKCIALAGISRMLTGRTLPPFSREPIQSQSEFPAYS